MTSRYISQIKKYWTTFMHQYCSSSVRAVNLADNICVFLLNAPIKSQCVQTCYAFLIYNIGRFLWIIKCISHLPAKFTRTSILTLSDINVPVSFFVCFQIFYLLFKWFYLPLLFHCPIKSQGIKTCYAVIS